MPTGQAYVDGSRPHFDIVPYLVGPKAIFVCLSCQRFLRELSNLADITIWNSMRVATAKAICDLFFMDLPSKLIKILGQESCDGIRVQFDSDKVLYMKVKETDKQLFLKSI
jgi:hypothetical protein